MKQQNIILTGFMGTGKSTFGKRLAYRLEYRFIDTDTEIEKRAGKSVAEIFRESGEAAFRKMEQELSEELSKQTGLVIATGGGLVMNPDNVTTLQSSGIMICLSASAEDILERVSRQPGTRPLLQEAEPLKKIKVMLKQREPIYSQFNQVCTSGKDRDQIMHDLLQLALSAQSNSTTP